MIRIPNFKIYFQLHEAFMNSHEVNVLCKKVRETVLRKGQGADWP